MFERIRRAFGNVISIALVPARPRLSSRSAVASPPELLESRELLTPQLVGALENTSEFAQTSNKSSKQAPAAPNLIGTWELTGPGFVGFLIVDGQNGKTFSATLTANASFTLPEIHFEGSFRGKNRLIAPKFKEQALPAGSFTGKLSMLLDSATTLHGKIAGKNNGSRFSFSISGIHISDV